MMERLRAVRELRERRAHEVVLHSAAHLGRAELRAREAAGAVSAHLEEVATEQDAAFDSLVGQHVSVASLLRRQGRFEVAAKKTAQLREEEGIARSEADARRAELDHVRSRYLQEVKRVEKISGLIEQGKSRRSAQQSALSELADDEDRGPSGPTARAK